MDIALESFWRMRKAIQLQVILWIEGEDQPDHNFALSTAQAVKDIISFGRSQHSKLNVTIKNIVRDTEYYGYEKPDD
jgi:hypothetical protein